VSDRVCYLARTAQGDRIVRVRLVGVRTDEVWPPASAAHADISARDAGAWIAERLRGGGNGEGEHDLRTLCVDIDGARCSWLTASGTDERAVATSMALGRGGEGGTDRLGATWSPPTTDDTGLQALAVATEAPHKSAPDRWQFSKGKKKALPARRLAVLAMPDVQARLVVDALDDLGINPGEVISLWHAMARAWDLGATEAQEGRASDARVVASTGMPTGILLIDEPGARLIWCWTSQGHLLAAGSQRLGESGTKIDDAVLSRMTNDWLAWSVQLGFGPSRMVCVMPEASGPTSVGTGAMYRILGRLWPNATVEMIAKDDPIGATLRELAVQESPVASPDPRQHLVALSQRPGRSHRALYRAGAMALVAGAIATAGVGWRLWGAASMARTRADGIDASIRETIAAAMGAKAGESPDLFTFERELSRRRDASRAPKGITPPKPILRELETIATVVGSLAASHPSVTLNELTVGNMTIRVRVTVPDTATGDELIEAIKQISGSFAEWRGEFESGVGGVSADPTKRPFRLDGLWRKEEPTGTGSGSGT
jgi:hypothetical protein